MASTDNLGILNLNFPNLGINAFEGTTKSQFNSSTFAQKNGDWEDFVIDVCASFKEHLDDNVVEEFSKLGQKGSIDEQMDSFKELSSLMRKKPRIA